MDTLSFDDIDVKLMDEALNMANRGFEAGEVPVGCVFVRFDAESKNKYEIIARAHNLTNLTKDATRHCEMLCINEVLKKQNANYDAEKVFEDAVLYVTVEPCIMCGYALNLMKIKKVYFGCWNDRFGGNGSIIDTQKMAPHHYETIGSFFLNWKMSLIF